MPRVVSKRTFGDKNNPGTQKIVVKTGPKKGRVVKTKTKTTNAKTGKTTTTRTKTVNDMEKKSRKKVSYATPARTYDGKRPKRSRKVTVEKRQYGDPTAIMPRRTGTGSARKVVKSRRNDTTITKTKAISPGRARRMKRR